MTLEHETFTPGNPAYWLVVQSRENWRADQMAGWRRYGMSERFAPSARQVDTGDVLILYIPTMLFAGTLRVSEDSLHTLGRESHYKEPYPYYIATQPDVMLPEGTWLDVHSLLGEMSFISRKGPISYRQSFRSSIRRIPHDDGTRIRRSLIAQADHVAADPYAAATELPSRHLILSAKTRLTNKDPDVAAYRVNTTLKEDPDFCWRLVAKAGLPVPFKPHPETQNRESAHRRTPSESFSPLQVEKRL